MNDSTYILRRVALFAALLCFWGCTSSKKVSEHHEYTMEADSCTHVSKHESMLTTNMLQVDKFNWTLDVIPMKVNPDGTLIPDTTRDAQRLVYASNLRSERTSNDSSVVVHEEHENAVKSKESDEEDTKTREAPKTSLFTRLSHYWHTCMMLILLGCCLYVLRHRIFKYLKQKL